MCQLDIFYTTEIDEDEVMDTLEVMQQIGRNIKRYRKGRGLTQELLAKKIGPKTERGTISNYETGKSPNMTVETLNALANALKVKPQDLFIPWPEDETGFQDSSDSLLLIFKDDEFGICPEEIKLLQQIDIDKQFTKTKERYLLLLTVLRMVNGGDYKVLLDALLKSSYLKQN